MWSRVCVQVQLGRTREADLSDALAQQQIHTQVIQ